MRFIQLGLGVFLLGFLALYSAVSWAEEPPKPIFVDTDLGTDVDDALALLYLLAKPEEYDLVGISTNQSDSVLRAQLTKGLLTLAGHEDIPVAAGLSTRFLNKRPVRDLAQRLASEAATYPCELPSKDTLAPEHGADLLIQAAQDHPGLTVLAIGPLSNVALALVKEPSIANKISQIVMVGGAIGLPRGTEDGTLILSYRAEYNFNSDPEAVEVVFRSNVPLVMSGLNPALQLQLQRSTVQQWRKDYPTSDLVAWTADLVEARLDRYHSDATHLGDVLGALAAGENAAEKGLTVKPLPLSLETWGQTLRTIPDPTGLGTPVKVVVSVDSNETKQDVLSAWEALFSQ